MTTPERRCLAEDPEGEQEKGRREVTTDHAQPDDIKITDSQVDQLRKMRIEAEKKAVYEKLKSHPKFQMILMVENYTWVRDLLHNQNRAHATGKEKDGSFLLDVS